MRLPKRIRTIAMMLQAICFCCALSGQEKTSAVKQNPSQRIPGLAYKQLRALGTRMSSVGREKTTYTGQLFDNRNNSATVRIVHDLFGQVRLEGFKAQGEALSFDGNQIKGTMDDQRVKGDSEQREDEELMEVFIMDNVEGMLESMRKGAAVRFLGSGIGPDPSRSPDYKGPFYDVYEVTAQVRFREGSPLRTRLYFFDSQTGLLARTRYTDYSVNPPEEHETRYTVWGDIDGSKYPARIEHYVNGKLQFDFIAEDIKNDKSADKSEY